ncbi:MAG: hypothetical protein EBY39_08910 [Flavobacteriia bacterium]|nr:hypothetical protein [Flavobacteriia bacterium]
MIVGLPDRWPSFHNKRNKMAVSIDTVYQRVLAIANKEQRGYITPQEFNLFAGQAQMKIFEQYFYDLNQFKRLPGTQQEVSDRISIVEEKLSRFYKYNQSVSPTAGGAVDLDDSGNNLSNLYRLNEVRVQYDTTDADTPYAIAEEVSLNDHSYLEKGTLTAPTTIRPVFKRHEEYITAYPTPTSSAYPNARYFLTYIKKPLAPKWTYNVVAGQALYNSGASDHQDFELHSSEETSLVNEILELAGIMMEKPGLVTVADREEDKKIQQEKS